MTSYRMSLFRHRRRTFLLCKETGMQKWAGMLMETGKAFVDPSAMITQMTEDSDFWSLPALTILSWRTLLVITKNQEDGLSSPNGQHNQIGYILVRKRLQLGVISAEKRSFPGADIGHWTADIESDHDLLMMTFHLRLKKKPSKPKHTTQV